MAVKQEGLFIALEGVDGIGKTTQLKLLANSLTARFPHCVTVTREPGGSPSAEKIREFLFSKQNDFTDTTNLLLFNAARAENISKVIKPAINSGKIVICDRFVLSTLAYQTVLHNFSKDHVLNLHNAIHNNFMPDITIILYTNNISSVFQRVQERKENSNTFDGFEESVYSKINNVYKDYYLNNSKDNLIFVNVDNKDIETIHCEIVEALDDLRYLDLTPCISIM